MSPNDNQYTKDRADAEVPVLKGPDVEILNAVTTLLREQRHFDRQTVGKFKKLFGDSNLKWWIIGAGLGGACELVRIIWDAGAFLWTHWHR